MIILNQIIQSQLKSLSAIQNSFLKLIQKYYLLQLYINIDISNKFIGMYTRYGLRYSDVKNKNKECMHILRLQKLLQSYNVENQHLNRQVIQLLRTNTLLTAQPQKNKTDNRNAYRRSTVNNQAVLNSHQENLRKSYAGNFEKNTSNDQNNIEKSEDKGILKNSSQKKNVKFIDEPFSNNEQFVSTSQVKLQQSKIQNNLFLYKEKDQDIRSSHLSRSPGRRSGISVTSKEKEKEKEPEKSEKQKLTKQQKQQIENSRHIYRNSSLHKSKSKSMGISIVKNIQNQQKNSHSITNLPVYQVQNKKKEQKITNQKYSYEKYVPQLNSSHQKQIIVHKKIALPQSVPVNPLKIVKKKQEVHQNVQISGNEIKQQKFVVKHHINTFQNPLKLKTQHSYVDSQYLTSAKKSLYPEDLEQSRKIAHQNDDLKPKQMQVSCSTYRRNSSKKGLGVASKMFESKKVKMRIE